MFCENKTINAIEGKDSSHWQQCLKSIIFLKIYGDMYIIVGHILNCLAFTDINSETIFSV